MLTVYDITIGPPAQTDEKYPCKSMGLFWYVAHFRQNTDIKLLISFVIQSLPINALWLIDAMDFHCTAIILVIMSLL